MLKQRCCAFTFRWVVYLILMFCLFSATAWGQSLTPITVEIPEERWITLGDGSRVYMGAEIGYIIAEQLFESKDFDPVLSDSQAVLEHVDPIRKQELAQITRVPVVPLVAARYVLSAEVQSLVYASGSRSNRLVYGFTPDHINPFNAGRAGSLENEFVVSPSQLQTCQNPDFFNGSFNVQGWGPTKSNFGANADEGAVINLFGIGFGLKQKKFNVETQVAFHLFDRQTDRQSDFDVTLKGSGTDLFIAGAYSGVSVAVEIQRRHTLTQALHTMAPEIANLVVGHVQSLLTPASANLAARIFRERPTVAAQLSSPHMQELLDLKSTVNPVAQAPTLSSMSPEVFSKCFGKKEGWFEQLIEGLSYLYGVWRYENVFDQPLRLAGNSNDSLSDPNPVAPPTFDQNSFLRIAEIDSGIDYNDSQIQKVAWNENGQAFGFDFISWDQRPSDDNGHGSAVAKYLARYMKVPFKILPVKVISPYGETNSSAIYDAFNYATQSQVSAVLAAWAPQAPATEAYSMGIALAQSHGIPVFTPATLASNKSYKSRALAGASVKLDAEGMSAVEQLLAWSQTLGGTK